MARLIDKLYGNANAETPIISAFQIKSPKLQHTFHDVDAHMILKSLNDRFNKGLDEQTYEAACQELDQLVKAAGHKYIKREGSKGNYKYIYKEGEKEGKFSEADEKFITSMMKNYNLEAAKKAIEGSRDQVKYDKERGRDSSSNEKFVKLWDEVVKRLEEEEIKKESAKHEKISINSAYGDKFYRTMNNVKSAAEKLTKPENYSILSHSHGFILTTNKRASQFEKQGDGKIVASVLPNGGIRETENRTTKTGDMKKEEKKSPGEKTFKRYSLPTKKEVRDSIKPSGKLTLVAERGKGLNEVRYWKDEKGKYFYDPHPKIDRGEPGNTLIHTEESEVPNQRGQQNIHINPSKLSKKALYEAVNQKYKTNFKVGDIEEFEDDDFRPFLDEEDIKNLITDELYQKIREEIYNNYDDPEDEDEDQMNRDAEKILKKKYNLEK